MDFVLQLARSKRDHDHINVLTWHDLATFFTFKSTEIYTLCSVENNAIRKKNVIIIQIATQHTFKLEVRKKVECEYKLFLNFLKLDVFLSTSVNFLKKFIEEPSTS